MFYVRLLPLILCFFCFAQEPPAQIDPVHLKLNLSKTSISPGENIQATVEINIDDGYVAYVDQFEVKPVAPKGLFLGETSISPSFRFYDKFSKKEKEGVRNNAKYIIPMEFPIEGLSPGEQNLILEIGYQACSEKLCLWPNFKKVQTPLKIISSGITNKALPSPDKKSFLDQFSLDQIPNYLNKLQSENKKESFHIKLFILAIVFFAGLLTSFTPCIFPMIPITLAVIGSRKENRSPIVGFFTSLIYVLGIAFTYSLLGAFAARSGQAFGSYLGHPAVIIGLMITFIAMGLSMMGFFEVKIPSFIENKLLKAKFSQSFYGVFLYGIIAGVVASPCVGPVLISILAFVTQQQNLIFGMVLLFVYALGLGQIFLVLGTFTGLINKLPKSGSWLNYSKYIFACIMFVMAFYYSRPLWQTSDHSSKVNWQTYSSTLMNQAKSENKPVILDFYADWCAACKELDYEVFSTEEVLSATQNFYWVQFDATKDSPEFAKLRKKYNILGLPTVLFFNSQGQLMKQLTLTGFEDKESFLKRIIPLIEKNQ